MSKKVDLDTVRTSLKQGREVLLWSTGQYGGIMMRATEVTEDGVVEADFEGECPPHPEWN